MKKKLVSALCIIIVSCSPDNKYKPTPTTKVIASKKEVIENRFSPVDTFLGSGGVRTKSQTVYYLVAEDGTVCEVGLTKFSQTKEGDSVASLNWKTKQ